ncbi:hypothetical protein IT418_00285, partial [bacterium]|nr:hypothetical protein [bacterium]
MKKFNSRLTILLISNAIIVMASAMIGPIYAAFVAKNIGGDLLEVGASYAVYAITSGGIMLLSSKFADKWRKEKLIMNLGYLIMSFAFFGYIFVNSLQELLFIQIMLGF